MARSIALRVLLAAATAFVSYFLLDILLAVGVPEGFYVAHLRLFRLLPYVIAIGGGLLAFAASAGTPNVRGLGRSALLGAAWTGGLGLVAGMLGPMLFAPHANQGPLLGLLITGPLGVFVGAMGGTMRWFAIRNRDGRRD